MHELFSPKCIYKRNDEKENEKRSKKKAPHLILEAVNSILMGGRYMW